MIKDMALAAFSAFFKTDRIRHAPLNVQLEPTTACNLNCRMCIRPDSVEKASHMEESVFHLAMKKLSPPRIVFAGAGEPLLHPRLFNMIGFCRTHGVRTMMSTNLVTCRETVDRLIEQGPHVLKVSIDAADAATYRAVRGTDAFAQILGNVRALVQGTQGKMEVRFEYVLMKENMAGLADVVSLADGLGVKRVYFRELQTEGMTEERRKELLDGVDFGLLRKSLTTAAARARELHIETNLRDLLSQFKRIQRLYARDNAAAGTGCLLPWLQLFVAVNGDVSPCCALYTNSGVKTGNVVENSRDELLNGAAMVCVRRGFRKKRVAPVCRDCIPRDFRKLSAMRRALPGF
ncbi:MAG: radical SAM protein [Fibrobacterota bacterium]